MGREKRPGAPAQGGVTRPTPGGFGEGAARAGHRADAGAGPSETTNAGLAGLSRTSVQVALDRQKRRAQFRQVQAGAGAEDGRGKRTRRGALAGPGADAVLVAGAHDTGAAGGPGAGWLERGGEPTARDRVLRALERRTEADDDMAALTAEVLAGQDELGHVSAPEEMEWEEAGEGEAGQAASPGKAIGGQGVIEVSSGSEAGGRESPREAGTASEGPARKRASRATAREEAAALALHRAHMLTWLASGTYADAGASDLAVQALAVSLLPEFALRDLSGHLQPAKAQTSGAVAPLKALRTLVLWYRNTFVRQVMAEDDLRHRRLCAVARWAVDSPRALRGCRGQAWMEALQAGHAAATPPARLTQPRHGARSAERVARDTPAGGFPRLRRLPAAAAVANRLAACALTRRGSERELVAVFLAMLRGLGMSARLVAAPRVLPRGARRQGEWLRGGSVRSDKGGAAAGRGRTGGGRTGAGRGRSAFQPLKGAGRGRLGRGGKRGAIAAAPPPHACDGARVPVYWVEVLVSDSKGGEPAGAEGSRAGGAVRWAPVYPLQGALGEEGLLEQEAGAPPGLVLGFEGSARDLTPRYSSDILCTRRECDREWVAAVAEAMGGAGREAGGRSLGPPSRVGVSSDGRGDKAAGTGFEAEVPSRTSAGDGASQTQHSSVDRTAAQAPAAGSDAPGPGSGAASRPGVDREADDLRQRERWQLAQVPKTIDAFKDHPTYALKRHLGQRQVLRPGTRMLGLIKGEPYYPREAVADVMAPQAWVRKGRQVKEEELDKPVKVLKPKAKGPARRGGDTDDADDGADGVEDEMWGGTNLYAEWQTEPWQAPVAEGGRVPRNAHGNVECPPLAPSLPIGTVHLDLRGAGQCCRQLGVDHAPALVGFERRGRGMYPVFKGIVVCTEHEAAVRQAWEVAEAVRVKKEEERREQRAVRLWEELVGSAIARAYVRAAQGLDRPRAPRGRAGRAGEDAAVGGATRDEERGASAGGRGRDEAGGRGGEHGGALGVAERFTTVEVEEL